MISEAVGMVLCAGRGTRLLPMTLRTPKAAIPFHGKPMAAYAIEALKGVGIQRLGVNLYHLSEIMQDALQPWSEGLIFHKEEVLLGTGGGVKALWKRLGRDKPLILCHGDTVFQVNLKAMWAIHHQSPLPITLALKLRNPGDPLKNVFVDQSNRIAGLFEHRLPRWTGTLMELAFLGIHILDPEVFDLIPDRIPYCLVTEFYPSLLNRGMALNPYLGHFYHRDLGTPERFLNAQKEIFEDPLRLGLDTALIDARVEIDSKAQIISPVRLVGPVKIQAHASVGPHVVLYASHGSLTVHAQASVQNASLWGKGDVYGVWKNVLAEFPVNQKF